MSIIFSRLHSVKSTRRLRPVEPFVVLFDPSNLPIRPFAGRMPKASPKPAPEFSAVEMRRIDDVRRSAFFDALDTLGGKAASEYAASEAGKAASRIRSSKLALAAQKSRESRKPYSVADAAWAAQMLNQSVEPDWDQLAGEAACMDRLSAGMAIL